MLLELSVQHCLSQEIKGMEIIGKRKLYGPFFWMGFNCLKATEPLQGDSYFLPFISQQFLVFN